MGSPRPLAIAYLLFFAALGAIVLAVNSLAPPEQANPPIGLELKLSEEQAPTAGQTASRNSRSLAGHLISDPALQEDTPLGPLPVIASDGRTALRSFSGHIAANDKQPRIAVVILGLNVGAISTKASLANLPASITLGLSPFDAEMQNVVDRAREAGHEILIELPMEPFDFPESDPGPHALLVAASAEENIKRLQWSMSRVTGYVGVANLLGGRFLGEQTAIEPVLSETARRGLLFFDDGANASSLALTVARHVKAPIATGTVTLDAIQTRDSLDKKLLELEAEARRNGTAIGVGSVYPTTISRVAEWARSVESRGFALVPISALAAIPLQETATQASAR